MPRRFLKRCLPDRTVLLNRPGFRAARFLAKDPHLFHLNRHSVSVAFFIGLFIAFLPMPGQIPLAIFAAVTLHCNLPITLLLVCISNPFTYPIIFFFAYKFGAYILLLPPRDFHVELSLAWLQGEFLAIWQPLLLGSLIFSLFFGSLGYVAVQWLWRHHVVSKWRSRPHSQRSA